MIIHCVHLQDFREYGLKLQIRNILFFIAGRGGVSGKIALEYCIYKLCFIGSFSPFTFVGFGSNIFIFSIKHFN